MHERNHQIIGVAAQITWALAVAGLGDKTSATGIFGTTIADGLP
jgi:hypothetical protein